MSTFARRSALLITVLVALISCGVVGIAYAAEAGLAQFDVLEATISSFENSIETAAARSGYDDSELHLAASIPVGAMGAQLAYSFLPERTRMWAPLVFGLGIGMMPGFAKELYDASQANNYFSGSDIGYDFLGALLGVGITYSIHLLARHLRRKAPAMRETARELGARMTGPQKTYIPVHRQRSGNDGSGLIVVDQK